MTKKENKSTFALTDNDRAAREAIAKGSNATQFLMSDLSARYPTEKPSDAWLTICKEEGEWIVQGGKYIGLNKALELTRETYTVYLLAIEAGQEPAKMLIHTCFENAVTLNRIRVQQSFDKRAHEKALKDQQEDTEEKETNEDVGGLDLTDTNTDSTETVVEVPEKFVTVLEEVKALLIAVKGARKDKLEEAIAASLAVIEAVQQ